MRTHQIIAAILILAGGACAGSQSEQVRDAHMEQADAQAKAERNAVEQAGSTRDQAIEQSHDAVTSNLEATNPPGESGAEKMVKVSEDRAKFQSDAQTKLDKLGVQLGAAREKLTVLGGRAPTSLKGELSTATTQFQTLQEDVKNLDKTPPSSWEARTGQVEKGLASLEDRVDDLTDKIEGV